MGWGGAEPGGKGGQGLCRAREQLGWDEVRDNCWVSVSPQCEGSQCPGDSERRQGQCDAPSGRGLKRGLLLRKKAGVSASNSLITA